MDNADQLLVQELLARVTALENGGGKDDSESGIRQRLQAERASRIEKKEADRFKANEELRTGPRPTSQHRREELARRTNNTIPSPETSRRSNGTPQEQAAVTGTSVYFYTWKDGQVAIVKVLCDGEPTVV